MGHKPINCFAYDSGINIFLVLGCLAITSIFIGYYSKDMIVGVESDFLVLLFFSNLYNINIFDAESINQFYKLLPVNFS